MVIGGQVILRLAPEAIAELAGDRVAALVSATNGKTSTTRLLATALEQAGPVCSQPTGANMSTGIVMTLSGSDPDATVVLEVDEAYLPRTMDQTHPRVLLLGNLSRDQLDRMNEVAMTARSWRTMLADHPDVIVVANGDDPMIEFAASVVDPARWCGSAAGQQWTSDSSVCAACGTLLRPRRRDLVVPRLRPQASRAAVAARGRSRHRPGRQHVRPDRSAAARAVQPGQRDPRTRQRPRPLGLDPAEGLRPHGDRRFGVRTLRHLQVGDLRIRLFLAKNPAGLVGTAGRHAARHPHR